MFAASRYRMARKLTFPTAAIVEQKLLRAGDLYGFMLDRFYQGSAFLVVITPMIGLVWLFGGIP